MLMVLASQVFSVLAEVLEELKLALELLVLVSLVFEVLEELILVLVIAFALEVPVLVGMMVVDAASKSWELAWVVGLTAIHTLPCCNQLAC